MVVFEMIKYHKQNYPKDIPLMVEEVAAHLDIEKVDYNLPASLHTEYSYGKRKLNSELLENFQELSTATQHGVPQLWKNKVWASEFADFILTLQKEKPSPKIVEIHPPFSDYSDLDRFLDVYTVFENKIKAVYPDVKILVENRCGSIYRGGKFVLSKIEDVKLLCKKIDTTGLSLQVAIDIPQIYTAHRADKKEKIVSILEQIRDVRDHIGCVHLWGKSVSKSGRKVAHNGDLNSYFGDEKTKQAFLSSFVNCFNDGIRRKMVLEVNGSNKDIISIIDDLRNVGVTFV